MCRFRQGEKALMKYYFAPMDGITDYVYRYIVWKHFPYWDKLYAPFIQPNDKPVIVPKEEFEIHPDNNVGVPMVPQILTSSADGFIKAGRVLCDYGYKEINLNIGCPAKIIVSKGKGAGMLADAYDLDKFFDGVFKYDWKVDISVKTRLGLTDNALFSELVEVFSKYPIKELIIHPRFRTDFYNGMPRLYEFEKAYEVISSKKDCNISICYNGNINSIKDLEYICDKYPYISSVMMGRGALSNPALIRKIRGGLDLTLEAFKAFHDDILESYERIGFNDKLLMYKMKEMWNYWSDTVVLDGDLLKKLRLAGTKEEYNQLMNNVYASWKVKENQGFIY